MKYCKLLILLVLVIPSYVVHAEGLPSIILDGIEDSIRSGSYASISIINGATARMGGELFSARKVTVDDTSYIKVALGGGLVSYPKSSGSGGGYGGRGGGEFGNAGVHASAESLDITEAYGGSPASGTRGDYGKTIYDGQLGYDIHGGYFGNGGGTLFIEADEINIEGSIMANGQDATEPPSPIRYRDFHMLGYGGGGGSGGCILLVAKEMNIGPSAVLQTNGGRGFGVPVPPYGGPGYGGGGGRIKLFYETGSVSPGATIESKAAPEWPAAYLGPDGTWFAADGTVYIQQVRSADVLVHPEKAGDLDGNGVIDSDDLAIFMRGWGGETTPAPTGKLVAPTKTPYYTATATYTVTPTLTASPTWTRRPTRTPTPTKTETPTPTQ